MKASPVSIFLSVLFSVLLLLPAPGFSLGWETLSQLSIIQVVKDSPTVVPGQSFQKIPLLLDVESVVVELDKEVHVHPLTHDGNIEEDKHVPAKGDWIEIAGQYSIKEKEDEKLFTPNSQLVIIYFNKFTGALFPRSFATVGDDNSYIFEALTEVGGLTKVELRSDGHFVINALVRDFSKSDFNKPVPFTFRVGDLYGAVELQLDSTLKYKKKALK